MILKKEDAGTHRLLVLVATLSFLLLTLAIIAVYLSPMEGYEYSVYESTLSSSGSPSSPGSP